MKKNKLNFLLLILLMIIPQWYSIAADKFTLSGIIKNKENGEALIGAIISTKGIKPVGAVSNAYGFYSLTLLEGTYIVQSQFLGYKTQIDTILVDRNQKINIDLTPELIKVREVVITGERTNINVTSTEMSANKLQIQELQSIPVLLGEKDILKTIQLLPGIKSAGEGSTGFYARGGRTDQNLIVLDEAPVYNSSHALGFLSVFNSDAIKDVTVITGGIPAEYGGRLSSVLDIKTDDGNTKEFGVKGGIGLISSRLTLQGPIVKDEGSFIVSMRRTYADVFLKLSSDTTINKTSVYFYDLNLKANYILGDRDRVFLSGYFGRDNFDYPNVFGFNWGNGTATTRWNHIYGDKFFGNTSLIYSNYEYTNTLGTGTSLFTINSGIQDVNGKMDFQYFLNSENTIKFGFNSIYHTFIPGTLTSSSTSSSNAQSVQHKYALEDAAYISHETEIAAGLKINYGLRFAAFTQLGPGTAYMYDVNGDVMDSTVYSSGKNIKTFTSLEPRISANISIDEESSVKVSFTRTAQFLHLLSNSTTTNPSDLWVPSSNNVKPQYADQIALGYFRNFEENEFETSVETYYKNMQNIIDYKNGADLQLNPNVESLLSYGKGWSYGVEFLVKKRFGQFTGWFGYTWSKTEEQFDKINNGNPFPARQDRTHDISIVAMYDYDSQWKFSATWVYYTGNAVTFPSGNYFVDGRLVPYYTERNGYRMPAYHRLDLSATYSFSEKSNLNLSIYNAYDRWNPYSIAFRQNVNDPTKTEAVQTTIFPIIPSLTYNFNF
jgi:hypothetical protein